MQDYLVKVILNIRKYESPVINNKKNKYDISISKNSFFGV